MYFRISLFVVAALISAVTPLRQGNQVLTQAQRVVIDSPQVISLKITPITRRQSANVYEKVAGPFKPESKIEFELVGTNNSLLTLEIRRWDTYAQNKLRLLRDNQEVSYREDVRDLIKEKHTSDSDFVRISSINLAPNEPKVLESLTLSDWYDPLGPGRYETFDSASIHTIWKMGRFGCNCF